MFKIKAELKIDEINKFYKKCVDLTSLGDKKPRLRTVYIFVIGVEKETGTYFYYTFNDFNFLFGNGNKVLTCDERYIDNGLVEMSLEELMKDLY